MTEPTLTNQTGATRALATTMQYAAQDLTTAARGYSTDGMDQHEVNQTLAYLAVIEHAVQQLRGLLEEKS